MGGVVCYRLLCHSWKQSLQVLVNHLLIVCVKDAYKVVKVKKTQCRSYLQAGGSNVPLDRENPKTSVSAFGLAWDRVTPTECLHISEEYSVQSKETHYSYSVTIGSHRKKLVNFLGHQVAHKVINFYILIHYTRSLYKPHIWHIYVTTQSLQQLEEKTK